MPPLTDINYGLSCAQDSIAITSSNQSGEIDVSSIKYRKYSDGQEFTSTIGFTVDISSDDGATYRKEATGIAVTTDSTFQSIRYEISSATGKDIDSTEITESIAKCSYIVRLTQFVSGKRFKPEILEVRYNGKNIDDILNMSVDEAIAFFGAQKEAAAKSIAKKLQPLVDVGLSYIKLGQSSSTLSGGESQRIKLAYFLSMNDTSDKPSAKKIMFIR